jgi:hypothetical protein
MVWRQNQEGGGGRGKLQRWDRAKVCGCVCDCGWVGEWTVIPATVALAAMEEFRVETAQAAAAQLAPPLQE